MDDWIATVMAGLPEDVRCSGQEPSDARIKEWIFEGQSGDSELWVSLIYDDSQLLRITVANYFDLEVDDASESERLKPRVRKLLLQLSLRGAAVYRGMFSSYLVLGSEDDRESAARGIGKSVRMVREYAPWSRDGGVTLPMSDEERVLPWSPTLFRD